MNLIMIKLQVNIQSQLMPDEMLQRFQDGINALCYNLERELPSKDRHISYKLGDTMSEVNL
jgi:hypothetical protein